MIIVDPPTPEQSAEIIQALQRGESTMDVAKRQGRVRTVPDSNSGNVNVRTTQRPITQVTTPSTTPDPDWKPDFTKSDPYEGAPPDYIDRVNKSFVPTIENPLPPYVGRIVNRDKSIVLDASGNRRKIESEKDAESLESELNQAAETKQKEVFERDNIKLPDGKYISRADFEKLSEKHQRILKEKGVEGLNTQLNTEEWEAWGKQAEAESAVGTQLNALDRLRDFGNSTDGYDIAKYLRNGGDADTLSKAGFGKDAIEEAKQYNEVNFGTGLKPDGKNTPKIAREEFVKNQVIDELGSGELPDVNDPQRNAKLTKYQAALNKGSQKYKDLYGSKNVALSNAGAIGEMVAAPVFRAIRPEVKLKDISKLEWILTGALVATAAIPGVRGVAAGVRAGKPLGSAVKTVALAEIKAPFTSLAGPDASAKWKVQGWTDIAETVARPGKVPIEALEIREHTVRIPVRATGIGGKGTKALQDTVTTKVIRNGTESGIVKGNELVLTKTALNRTTPAVVHASPDVRPFMNGVKVTKGREGGLFVSPTLHSRFTKTSAFGDVTEGGVRGGLIIRDKNILAKLQSSDKLYKGTAEVEKVIPGGTSLPKPSQILITRDMQGNKITLLVFGNKFTQREIVQMKLMGAADTVKQIFSPAYKLNKVNTNTMDELATANNKTQVLKTELTAAKKAKNTKLVGQLNKQLKAVAKDVRRLSDKLDNEYTPSRVNPILINTGRKYLAETRTAVRQNSNLMPSRTEEVRSGQSVYSNNRVTAENVRTGRTENRGDTTTRITEQSRVTTGRTSANGRTEIPTVRTIDPTRVETPTIRTPDTHLTDIRPPDIRPPDIRTPNISPPDTRPPNQNVSIKTSSTEEENKDKVHIKPGSLAWQQGALEVDASHPGLEKVIMYREPPYTKTKYLVGKTLAGYKEQGNTPKETIQVIGGPVKQNIDIPVGGLFVAHVKANQRKITFTRRIADNAKINAIVNRSKRNRKQILKIGGGKQNIGIKGLSNSGFRRIQPHKARRGGGITRRSDR